MSESAVYRPHPESPAVATLRDETPTGAWAGLRAERFELVSRGDFVPGILYRSGDASDANAPLLLIQHATGDGADANYLACAAAWARKGLAVASIDLPLHGTRSSPKLSERLFNGIGRLARGSELDLDTAALVEEFARQTTSDLIRTLDALCAVPGIDGDRLGFMGFGLGAIAGTYLLAHDPRPSAAVLALVGGGRGPADLDPSTYLEQASNLTATSPSARRTLVVAADNHAHITSNDVEALFKATPEPKELLQSSGSTRELSKDALAKIETFLSEALGF